MSQFDRLMDAGMGSITGVFGDVVTVTPPGGVAFDVEAIFDRSVAMLDGSGEVPVETLKPLVSFRKSALAAMGKDIPERDTSVRIATGEVFKIVARHSEDTSEVRFVLMRKGAL